MKDCSVLFCEDMKEYEGSNEAKMLMKVVCIVFAVLSVAHIILVCVKYSANRTKIKDGKYILIAPKTEAVLVWIGVILYQGIVVFVMFFDIYRALIFEMLLIFFILEFVGKLYALVSDNGVMIKWMYVSKMRLSASLEFRAERKNCYSVWIKNEHMYEHLLIDKKKLFLLQNEL